MDDEMAKCNQVEMCGWAIRRTHTQQPQQITNNCKQFKVTDCLRHTVAQQPRGMRWKTEYDCCIRLLPFRVVLLLVNISYNYGMACVHRRYRQSRNNCSLILPFIVDFLPSTEKRLRNLRRIMSKKTRTLAVEKNNATIRRNARGDNIRNNNNKMIRNESEQNSGRIMVNLDGCGFMVVFFEFLLATCYLHYRSMRTKR